MPEVIEKKKRTKAIPASLVYEEMDGKPIYRKGYGQVLAKKKTLEEIMGSSIVQSLVVSAIASYLRHQLAKQFAVVSNESGIHLAKGNNLASDVAVYNKKDITNPFSKQYFDFPAQLVVEVDIKAETENFTTQNDYVIQKTEKLLTFGIPRVIWIFIEGRKIMVAEPGKDWIIANWNREVELMEGLRLNLEALLKEEGIL